MESMSRRSIFALGTIGMLGTILDSETFGRASAAAQRIDASYAPQFRVGTGSKDVIEFVYSLTCPDCANFYRSQLRDVLLQIRDGRRTTVIFHNLVRGPADLEFSTQVLLAHRYGEMCLEILEYNGKSHTIMSAAQLAELRARYPARNGANPERAQFALALLNKYALDSLGISSTPTVFRNQQKVTAL